LQVRAAVEEAAAEQAEIGDIVGAQETLKVLEDFWRVKGMVDIARIRLRAKDLPMCRRLLEEAFECAEQIRRSSDRREVFLRIAMCAVNLQDTMPLAETAWHRSEAIGSELGEFAERLPFRVYHVMVGRYYHLRDNDALIRCASWNVENSQKWTARCYLARAYADLGEHSAALALAGPIPRSVHSNDDYWSLVAEINMIDGRLAEMTHAIERIDKAGDRVDAYCKMARGLEQRNAMGDAAKAIDNGLSTAEDRNQFHGIAKAQVGIGDLDGAYRTFRAMLRRYPSHYDIYLTVNEMCETAVSAASAKA